MAAKAAAVDPDDVTILENKVFLNSLRQALKDPVGMPAAMLDWRGLTIYSLNTCSPPDSTRLNWSAIRDSYQW